MSTSARRPRGSLPSPRARSLVSRAWPPNPRKIAICYRGRQPRGNRAPPRRLTSQASDRASVKLLAACEHIDYQLYALDLRLWALRCLQPVGNRIQIGPVERCVELRCLGVTCELLGELRRYSCLSRRVVRSGPTPVGFRRLHLPETSRRHLTFLDKPIHMCNIYPRPTAFRPAWGESLHPGVCIERQLLPIYPTETQRLVKGLGVGDRWNSRVFLINPQEQSRGPGVLFRQPCAKFLRCPKTPRRRRASPHERTPRRARWRGAGLSATAGDSSADGVQTLPVRSRMYCRIILRTTCEGVTSSSAHSRSNKAFLRGSMRIVRRALRSSRVKLAILRILDCATFSIIIQGASQLHSL